MYIPHILLVFCMFLVPVSAGPYFLEIYPDTWLNGDEDEYVTIGWDRNPGTCTISDGEGTITFSPTEPGLSSCTIARNGEQYKRVWGRYPSFEILDSSPLVPQVTHQGRFQMGNKKDDLTLTCQGIIWDCVTWPEDFKPRTGQIHFRSPDGAWDPRVLMAGGSRLTPETFQNVSGTTSVSPDCSRQVLEDVIKNSGKTILLNIYEFTDPGLAELLCDACNRGVTVSVLMEGSPVGGVPHEEFPVIYALTMAGADVRMMDGTGEEHPPYRFNHAKYLVSDGHLVFLTTENFKEHSFPHAGFAGNRGWAVVLDNEGLAQYFSEVFLGDFGCTGVNKASGREGAWDDPVTDGFTPVFAPMTFEGAMVTPVFSPDTGILIADMINESSDRVWIQQAYIKEYPKNGTNPFLAAAVNAARRGVDVRIQLDGYYYNIEGDQDNDEMVTWLNTLAARENISLKAKVLYPEKTGLLKVHTKGVIADDKVLVSSMNWNENSACFNREAGAIIHSRDAASYFATVFLLDWAEKSKSTSAGKASVNDPEYIKAITLAAVMIFLIILYRRYHR